MTTTTVRAGRGPLFAARIGWGRGLLEVREFLRQRESVVFTLLFPIILLLFFTQIVKYEIPGGLSFAQYFVPGILAVGLFGASFQTLAIQVSTEREKGMLKRLEGTPMPPAAYFIGKIIMSSPSWSVRRRSCSRCPDCSARSRCRTTRPSG